MAESPDRHVAPATRRRGRPKSTSTELTPRQAAVLRHLYEATMRAGIQPSTRELAAAFGYQGPNGAYCHLKALARKGWIGLPDAGFRSLRLLRRPDGRPFTGFVLPDDPDRPISLDKREEIHEW